MDSTSLAAAPTLLVVDDNVAGLKATVRILQQAGYAVAQAADGAEALRQVRALRPALVLLDVVMPDISGTEVLRQIRADPDLAGVSVVMFSAHMTQSDQQAAGLDAGADGYIARPISNVELVARVRSQLRQRELTEKLRASEAQYRRLFEAAKDGILILNAETGMIEDVNLYLTELLGFTREQFLRKKVWELSFLKNMVASQEKFHELQRVGYVRYEDLPLEAADGRKVAVEFVSNVYEVNGAKVIQCNIRNITERKQAQAALQVSEERYRALVDRAPTGIFVNVDDQFAYVNEAFCRILGASSPEQLLGRPIYDRFLPALHDVIRQRIAHIRSTGEGVPMMDQQHVRLDGSLVDVETMATATTFHGRPAIQVIVNDVTHRKQAEAVLKERAAELERFHRLSVGRELRMVDLKKEVNELAKLAGRTPPYDLAFLGGKMGHQTQP